MYSITLAKTEAKTTEISIKVSFCSFARTIFLIDGSYQAWPMVNL